jgi:hypothetical protein
MRQRWLNTTLSAALVWACISCAGPPAQRTETRIISRTDANAVMVDLRMSSGHLNLRGGGNKLMHASFHLGPNRTQPRLVYAERGSSGYLQLSQQLDAPPALGVADETWDVIVTDAAPIGLNLTLGTGRAHLDLRGLRLFRLTIKGHADELTLDLRDIRTGKLTVLLLNGPGTNTLYLPDHLPVEVRSKNPLIEIRGNLHRLPDDNTWVNARFGTAPLAVSILIDADAGPVRVVGNE